MHSKKITVRFASAISAAVIGFTSTAISFFDCPVYAAYGGAAWGEFFGFYSLLEGFGFGQDNTDFINSVDNWIDSLQPEEKPREDYDGEWMTDAQYWQQCQYDKFTGWLDNLVGSWSESYDAVGDVGSGGISGGLNFYVPDIPDGFFSSGGISIYSFSGLEYPNLISGDSILHDPFFSFSFSILSNIFDYSAIALVGNQYHLFVHSVKNGWHLVSKSSYDSCQYYFCYYGVRFTDSYTYKCRYDLIDYPLYNDRDVSFSNNVNLNVSCSQINSILNFLGCSVSYPDFDSVLNYLSSISISDDISISGKKYVNSDGFVGPVYTYPAAQELARQNKTSTGIRLDVKTADGTPDVKAALDGAGVSTVDELAASVAAGDVAMQDVFADAKVTPYVVADTTTGVVVTDLGVAADAAGVKPVALTNELTVPADLTNAATYAIQGKTWDPDMAKYRLPLFQYFPFCLPWDIYQVLSAFSADPVAPQIEIPIGKFFANKKSFDGSAVANYTETLNLGDEKFSKWFSALRLLESAGIIIGLVLISVHLIHGGR